VNAHQRIAMAHAIATARASAGYSQQALATKLGVSIGCVRSWERLNGRPPAVPTSDVGIMLADVLGVELRALIFPVRIE
jgi:ribosome-binding protein aMBF1 (putative translation factor)